MYERFIFNVFFISIALVSIECEGVFAIPLRAVNDGEHKILQQPCFGHRCAEKTTELHILLPETAEIPQEKEKEKVPSKEDGQIRKTVFISVFVMTACIYMIGYAALFFTRYYPPKGPKGYVDFGEDSEDDFEKGVGDDKSADKGTSEAPGTAQGESQSSVSWPSRQLSRYMESGCVAVSGDDLVNDVGISAMCVFQPDDVSGITRLPNKVAIPLIAVQSELLQVGLLYFLSMQLRSESGDTQPNHPVSIIVLAIYLHFLNCFQEFPYSWQLFTHLTDFHPELSHLTILGGVLITDAFVVPILSFVIGGLYLCTSVTVGDVILNAVAVAFVREIDNWILGLSIRADFFAGKVQAKTVHIPINKTVMRRMSWAVIFVPVVPLFASASIIWIAFGVLRIG